MCAASQSREQSDDAPPPEKRPRRRSWLRRGLRVFLIVALSLPALWTYARFGRLNFHIVVPGQVYRSAQPTAGRFRTWANRHGFRTVINLRGGLDRPEVQGVMQVAEELEIEFVTIRLPNKRLPDPKSVRRLIEAIETAEQPILLHCRAGADRSGIASALAAMAIGGEDFDEARGQMSPYYLHLDPFPDHIGALLTRYEEHCRQQNQPTRGWDDFRAWAIGPYAETLHPVTSRNPKSRRTGPSRSTEASRVERH